MDLKEKQLTFICLNSSFNASEGKLELALPFYCDHGHEIPEDIKLHVQNGAVHSGKFVPSSFSFEGLKSMMSRYGLKGCDVAVLEYLGVGDFNVKFYNRYAVEMTLERKVPDLNMDNVSIGIEEDRNVSTFRYNAYHNFATLYNLRIEPKHLEDDCDVKVLSRLACNELGMMPSLKYIKLGFEDHEWKIKLKWINGEALFNKTWCSLVKFAKLMVGDVLTLYNSGTEFNFKLAIFERSIFCDDTSDGGNGNFLKIMSSDVLDAGELEVPRVFMEKFGHTMENKLRIELGGGQSTEFRFSASRKKIYNMHSFICKFDIDDDYVLFFNYLGCSRFSLSVYDSQRCNHLRDEDGDFRYEDFMDTDSEKEVVVLSCDDEDGEQDIEDGMQNEQMSFTATLKPSHVDMQTHGVYFPRFMWPVYQNWRKRTKVTLTVGSKNWKVDILRSQKRFRFGKGWDAFVLDNGLVVDQTIKFEFVGNSTFRVRI